MAQEIKVAIQGGPASFHDMAARQYFAAEPVATLPCMSFRQLCDSLEAGNCDHALMAIENIVAGSIVTNYSLLQQYNFQITGEMWLLIGQNLMALPGQSLKDIKTVFSHPVALLQCGNYLKQQPHLHPQEADDTAESARKIREKNLFGIAAIASRQAADCYGLTILEENIADLKDNYTRFLVLSKTPAVKPESANKATLILELPHMNGSMGAVTELLHKLSIRISLIESLPVPINSFAHFVAIDIISNDNSQLQNAIDALKPLVKHIKLLGLYRKADYPLKEMTKALASSTRN